MNAGRSINQKRTALSVALLLAFVAGVVWPSAQNNGTVMPTPIQQFLDANGDPVTDGKICTYAAGTTTPLPTFADASLTTPHTNPITLNSSGRPVTSGGTVSPVYLSPSAYKIVLMSGGTSNSCNDGSTVWTADNVNAMAPYNVSLDVPATAGEGLAAGQVVYLHADGKWYLADADTASESSEANLIGIALAAISQDASGSVRMQGRVTGLSGLVTGASYYVSQTEGALTSSAPANRRFVGIADSPTSIVLTAVPYDLAAPSFATLNVTGGATMGSATIGGLLRVERTAALTRSALFSTSAEDGNTYIQLANDADSWNVGIDGSAGDRFYVFNSNSAPGTRLTITPDGAVQAPSQPGFLAYNSANDTGVSSGATVDFDTEVYDTGSNFANDTFTAPVTGIYQLCAVVFMGTHGEIQIVTSNRTYEVTNSSNSTNFCVFADMDAGDTAHVTVTFTGGGTITVTGSSSPLRTYFSGRLMP